MIISITDLTSFQLALLGIMVSVLTLVFAIVVGKRDELRTLNSFNDTLAKNRKVALNNSLNSLISFCHQIIAIIVTLLLLYISSIALNYIICDEKKYWMTIIETGLTVFVLIWIVVISIVIWNKINK